MANPICFFRKGQPFSDLSNFAPSGFEADGLRWPTVEHYFQAQKFEDVAYRERIRSAPSPKDAKTLGRARMLPLRSDWESVKEAVMKKALRLKFQNPRLRSLLLSTGNRMLLEDSPYDRYWGGGRDGKGKNRLGVLLMEVRDEIRSAM
jgi:ribA/ribD-fused uncharacterized protein